METGKSSALTVNVYELLIYELLIYDKGKGKSKLYPRAGHEDPERE